MSLLKDPVFNFECVRLMTSTADSPTGGFVAETTEGEHFNACIGKITDTGAILADKDTLESSYNVLTAKDVILKKPERFKRLLDGKVFEVTSDGTDKATPESSKMNLRAVTAEVVEI